MKKALLLFLAIAGGLTALPDQADARPRTRVVWEMVDGRPVRRVVYFDGDRPYYTYRGERRWVRSYWNDRPRYEWREGRRVYGRPSIELNF